MRKSKNQLSRKSPPGNDSCWDILPTSPKLTCGSLSGKPKVSRVPGVVVSISVDSASEGKDSASKGMSSEDASITRSDR